MHNQDFEAVWREIQRRLPGEFVPNWTVLKGNLGDSMKVLRVRGDRLEIDTPGAKNLVVVPKEHFRRVWEIWALYTDGQFPRSEMTEMTFFSKYIISILHWLETERTQE